MSHTSRKTHWRKIYKYRLSYLQHIAYQKTVLSILERVHIMITPSRWHILLPSRSSTSQRRQWEGFSVSHRLRHHCAKPFLLRMTLTYNGGTIRLQLSTRSRSKYLKSKSAYMHPLLPHWILSLWSDAARKTSLYYQGSSSAIWWCHF